MTNCEIVRASFKEISERVWHLYIVDSLFSAFFTCELLVRFLAKPTECVRSIVHWLEVTSMIPFYVFSYNFVMLQTHHYCLPSTEKSRRFFVVVRVLRVFRLCQTLSHYPTFRAFLYTLKSSLREIAMLFTLVVLTITISGSTVSLVESTWEDESDFEDVLWGLWWALATTSTVGYGDAVTKSPFGRLLTVVVAMSGILVIALATPMISGNFDAIYSYLCSNKDLFKPAATRKEKDKISSKIGEIAAVEENMETYYDKSKEGLWTAYYDKSKEGFWNVVSLAHNDVDEKTNDENDGQITETKIGSANEKDTSGICFVKTIDHENETISIRIRNKDKLKKTNNCKDKEIDSLMTIDKEKRGNSKVKPLKTIEESKESEIVLDIDKGNENGWLTNDLDKDKAESDEDENKIDKFWFNPKT